MDAPDLVEDVKACPEIMDKIQQADRYYAQNLYCAWSNMQWQKRDTWPILADQFWSASWRSAGGIVADLRGQGEDYMDYYCSGIKGGMSYDTKDDDEYFTKNRYVSEGEVTDEIAEDLNKLGWYPVPYDDDFV